jgi:hypothetical protein
MRDFKRENEAKASGASCSYSEPGERRRLTLGIEQVEKGRKKMEICYDSRHGFQEKPNN